MIECRNIAARVGNFELHEVSFSIPDAGHAVLTGPTASGKTTLLEIIAGAVAPRTGTVRIGGVDVTASVPELRGAGFVPQHGYLFPHLDTRRNIDYGARDNAIVAELAGRFCIAELLDRRVTVLSGGERQLVALCRALAARPRALLLDEPFSALDADRRARVMGEFAVLQAEWGFTVLHVTHDETDAESATLRMQMADGRLSSVGMARA